MLEQGIGYKKSERGLHPERVLTDEEKVEMFDTIVAMHAISSDLIGSAKFKRREAKRVQKARVERGYVPKKKTTKKEYDEMLAKLERVVTEI